MNGIISQHGTKIYGALTAFFGALQGLITTGAFNNLLSPVGVGWLGISSALATAVLGGMTMARGFSNSTAEKVASAMETAIKSTPGQGGFARIGMLLAVGIAALVLLTGCKVNPETGEREISETGKATLAVLAGELTDRYLAESPDRARSVANIRNVALRLQAVTDVVTITDLRARLDDEIAKLSLSELDRRSVNRFLPLLEALLRDYIGRDELDSKALVRVNEFLNLVLLALPPT